MKACVFPGQGSQYAGMGLSLYQSIPKAKYLFEQANEILGFNIADIMFYGTEEDLTQTKVTQPAIYLHSTILTICMGERFCPDMVAGHSLGEFSALVANKCLKFEDGLNLVAQRAMAMQKACEEQQSGMAAVTNLNSDAVNDVCKSITGEIVVAANYNHPNQTVISGTLKGIEQATGLLLAKGARRVLPLKVGGAFHSPLMEKAKNSLATAIEHTHFYTPVCPVYQNYTAMPSMDGEEIKDNLIAQLTAPVKWMQTVRNMICDGATSFLEIGPGEILKSIIKKIDITIEADSISTINIT
ncbi:MAG: ACP S-malonyltransferase [Bacteroidales bacterium]|nr:ACP S-malonyltransferase [Bacteroidales bacterium]